MSTTEQTVMQLLETAGRFERRLDNALSFTKGISFSEYRILNSLRNREGVPRIELANNVGLTASAVTRALKPLEKIGLIATEKNDRDARQSLAVLTKAGERLLNEAQGILRDTFKSLSIDKLNKTKQLEFQAQLGEVAGGL